MPTTDNSISTRIRFIKGRVLGSFALSNPIKRQLDQSNETYEIIQQGEKPYVIQPPIGGIVETICVCADQPIEVNQAPEPDRFVFESVNRGTIRGYSGAIFSSPVVGPNGNVYYGNATATFRCISGKSGSIIWSFTVSPCDPGTDGCNSGDNFEGNPILYNNVVYFGGTTHRNLYAINATTGLLKWSYAPSPSLDIYSKPVFSPDKSVVYCSNNAACMFAVYTATGLPVPGWPVLNVAGNGISINNANARVEHVVANDGTVYSHGYNSAAGFLDTYTGVFALNPNGTIKWQNSDSVGRFVLNNATTILYAITPTSIIAYNASTGASLWTYEHPYSFDPNGSPRLNPSGTVLYYPTNGRFSLIALNLQTQTLLWDFNLGSEAQSTPVIASNGDIYCTGLRNKTVWAIHSDGTLKWYYVTGGSMYSSPALSPDETIVYAGSYDTGLYALSTETGLPV